MPLVHSWWTTPELITLFRSFHGLIFLNEPIPELKVLVVDSTEQHCLSLWNETTLIHSHVIKKIKIKCKIGAASLLAIADYFTCNPRMWKKVHKQFTCVTCSLLAKIGEFTYVDAASTSLRIHDIYICLWPHVLAGNSQANLHAELMHVKVPTITCNKASKSNKMALIMVSYYLKTFFSL